MPYEIGSHGPKKIHRVRISMAPEVVSGKGASVKILNRGPRGYSGQIGSTRPFGNTIKLQLDEGGKHVTRKWNGGAEPRVGEFGRIASFDGWRMPTCWLCEIAAISARSGNILMSRGQRASFKLRIVRHVPLDVLFSTYFKSRRSQEI